MWGGGGQEEGEMVGEGWGRERRGGEGYHVGILSTEQLQESRLVHFAWCLDDGTLTGKSAWCNYIVISRPPLGFHVNPRICELYGTGDLSLFPATIQASSALNLDQILGAPIGVLEF